jgi:methylglyoxal synthase
MSDRTIATRKRIALIAHDNKKAELIDWVYYNRGVLSRHELFATGTTGKLIEEAIDRPVKKFLSGPLGGDQQIGALVAEGKIDVLIFSGTQWRLSLTTQTLKLFYAWGLFGIFQWPVIVLPLILY